MSHRIEYGQQLRGLTNCDDWDGVITTTSAPQLGVVGMRKARQGGCLSLLVVIIAIAGCGAGAGNHDYSSAIVRSIQTSGAGQIQRATNGVGRSGTAVINDASCVQTAGTENYSCIVHYTYHNSEGIYKYDVNVSATCASGGTCQWHVDGGGTLVSAEPA